MAKVIGINHFADSKQLKLDCGHRITISRDDPTPTEWVCEFCSTLESVKHYMSQHDENK